MTVKRNRVSVDAQFIRQQLKEKKLTPQIVLALAGYKEIGATSFNRYLKENALPDKIAVVLVQLGLTLHDS